MEGHSWRTVIEESYDDLYRFCLVQSRDPHLAADLLHDTIVRMLVKAPPIEQITLPRGYLFQVARRIILDRFRWLKRWRGWHGLYATTAPTQTALPEEVLALRELMHRLPARQREVFTLRNLIGLSTAECAETLGISEGSVKTHLSRALANLEVNPERCSSVVHHEGEL